MKVKMIFDNDDDIADLDYDVGISRVMRDLFDTNQNEIYPSFLSNIENGSDDEDTPQLTLLWIHVHFLNLACLRSLSQDALSWASSS